MPNFHKIAISPLGLQVREVLSFDEWAALAPSLGTAMRSMAFVIGDWLLYGEDHFAAALDAQPSTTSAAPPVSSERYRAAHDATGLDAGTLRNYAHVSRKVHSSLRNDRLSWEHHRAVAKLEPEEQTRWLALAANSEEKISTRRLRASISKGRLLAIDELATPPAEQGVANHIPPINRLSSWWIGAGGERWLGSRSVDQIEALLRDFEPVARIIDSLQSRLESRTRARPA